MNLCLPFRIKSVNNAKNLIKRHVSYLNLPFNGCRTTILQAQFPQSNQSKQIRFNSTVSPVETTGFIANIWQSISNSTPVAYVQQSLVDIHDFTGLPWWASIVMSTILFRSIVTLPLTIYQHKITARLEKISIEMLGLVNELKKEANLAMKTFQWTEQQTRTLRKQWKTLVIRDNCHPAKTFIVLWGQIPLWIFQSAALRNLVYMLPNPTSLQAQIVVTEMTLGGFGWIPNLTEVDNSYILPVILGIINLAIIEIQSMVRTRPATRFQNVITNIFRGLSLLMIPVACTVPSALTVYWVSSSCYGLTQNLLLMSPIVRRAFRIPKTPSELENPYEHLLLRIKQRVGYEAGLSVSQTTKSTIKKNKMEGDKIQKK
uniref:Membrane insertase YidC/Oxa/ALB C-terminal domain-containing protein n=1 Tax=Glossina brevipalpis TaxID=37001 RepID=A0A1A9W7L8_9MUSC